MEDDEVAAFNAHLKADGEQLVGRTLADLEHTAGLELQAELRWNSPDEQLLVDQHLDRLANEADAHGRKRVVIGAEGVPSLAQPLAEYVGFWVLQLPGQVTSIHRADQVVDVIQEYVIEQLWGLGRSTAWPECPVHGGHPLDVGYANDVVVWQCPRDPSLQIPVGHLADDPRF